MVGGGDAGMEGDTGVVTTPRVVWQECLPREPVG